MHACIRILLYARAGAEAEAAKSAVTPAAAAMRNHEWNSAKLCTVKWHRQIMRPASAGAQLSRHASTYLRWGWSSNSSDTSSAVLSFPDMVADVSCTE